MKSLVKIPRGQLANVFKEYATITALLADQAKQSSNRLYKVIDASDDPNLTFPSGETKLWAYYEYKEVATSDIDDYTLISAPYGNQPTDGTPAHGISNTDINNWNTAHDWGDHSQEGYATEDYVDNNVFSGNYNDLSNKPTIPTNNNQLTNGAGYITSSALNGYATEDYVDQQEVNVVTSPTATVSIDIREYKSSVINVTNDFTINLTNLPDSKKSIVHNITLNYQGTQRNIQWPSGSGTNLFGDTLGADPSKTYLVTIEAINISNSTNPIMMYNIAVSEAN